MNCTRLFCLAGVLAACAATANANLLFYTFGGDFVSLGATGAPDSLNRMDSVSVASVTDIQTPVGNGNIGFNGGLVAAGNLLYSIGNDISGVATLYSMDTSGQGLTPVSSAFNTTGGAAGIVFQNGLAAIGNTFYAIGAGTSEGLYQIGNGTATLIQTLNTFNGTYAGLAWDPALSDFYAIIADGSSANCTGDCLVRFALGGSVSVVANLTNLDGTVIGTHLGGLTDVGGGILYDIYTDPNTFTGVLEQINLSGSPSTTTLYDSQVPLAQNAGIAAFAVPEPAPQIEVGVALVLLCGLMRRFTPAKRSF
jgi:hypothetical protein